MLHYGCQAMTGSSCQVAARDSGARLLPCVGQHDEADTPCAYHQSRWLQDCKQAIGSSHCIVTLAAALTTSLG